ncbi:longitudinals lacking protein, isoforms A/B/D/L-like isoform X2 [Schistocerca piceifrons]|uniref:longitudinals lacking protein, isoforms A/B/D/L-like isoform X2 n=1 Tax=Schistocerca piceifrons TaxID=274613 RepID=UPI001F5F6B14|nr:longitudinals lacking protein, isoforms A/B/D/L-like isoform X2 [Schistocerca piceifrons]
MIFDKKKDGEITGTGHDIMLPQESQRFPCHQCHNVYCYQSSLARHIKFECGKVAQIQCPFCSYRSRYRADMTKHIRFKHRIPEEEVKLLKLLYI